MSSKDGYGQFFQAAKQAKAQPGPKIKNPAPQNRPKTSTSKSEPSRFKLEGTPEQQLRQQMNERAQDRKAKRSRTRKGPPVFATIMLTMVLLLAAIGYQYSSQVEAWLEKIEVGFLSPATAADPNASGKSAEKGPEKKPAESTQAQSTEGEKSAAAAGPEGDKSSPETGAAVVEDMSFFNKLNERKRELDLREAELNKLEEELHKQKVELDEKLKSLEATRTQISQALKSRVATDQEKVDKLVQFYGSMKPQQAAKVMETINEDLAVEVLDKMKKKSAADILNVMDPKKAQRLSEMIAGYRRTE